VLLAWRGRGLARCAEMVGRLFHGNYAPGVGMLLGATSGRIAGIEAAGAASSGVAGAPPF